MSTRNRIALILGLMGVMIVVLFGITIYYFQNKYAYEDFYKRLETRAKISFEYNLYSQEMDMEHLKSLRNSYLEKLEKEKEFVISADGKFNLDGLSTQYKLPLSFLQDLKKNGKAREKIGNAFFVGLKGKKGSKNYLVVVSAENYYVTHHLLFLRNMLFGGLGLVILIILVFSVFYSKHIYDPINMISEKVRQISTENIHLRLDQSPENNEISALISTFNDLLNRIETAFESQKNFISNASHELTTPLTTIIGQTEVTLMKARTQQEYEASLNNILIQAERLDRITKSLLFLAQTGYKGKSIGFERLRIDEVIWQTLHVMDQLNPDHDITLDTGLLPEDPKKLKVNGNRELLQMALANLLSNACKYSNNGPVSIAIASSDSRVIIVIEDKGIGIPESEIGFIYDPFFRATNTKLFEGYGIGLPLTRNVILMHKGSLKVNSKQGQGTTVQITLPLYGYSEEKSV